MINTRSVLELLKPSSRVDNLTSLLFRTQNSGAYRFLGLVRQEWNNSNVE